MDIVSAIKRLERAGAEHSRTTEKLRNAVAAAADEVAGIVPRDQYLPRGYLVTSGGHLQFPDNYEDDHEYLDLPNATRATILRFAQDVAEGWLDEVATWMEARAAEDTQATVTLEAAKF